LPQPRDSLAVQAATEALSILDYRLSIFYYKKKGLLFLVVLPAVRELFLFYIFCACDLELDETHTQTPLTGVRSVARAVFLV